LNRDNWLVETTSSGKLFHTLITRTAKKCFLQLARASAFWSQAATPRPDSEYTPSVILKIV